MSSLEIILLVLILLGLLAFLIIKGIVIIRPVEDGLIETFGKFTGMAKKGLNITIPFIQEVVKINITEKRVDIKPQTIITKDKLNVDVDGVVYYKVFDARKACYSVDDYISSVPSLARTTLRAVIGKMTLSDANEKRQEINNKIEKELEKQTQEWGISVIRVELQRIEPPKDVQEAMNMVVKAENEKIAAKDFSIAKEIAADGLKKASIKKAEGLKQAEILTAQGKKEAYILKAQGESEAFNKINKSFTGNSQILKRLEVTQSSLKDNAKIILTEKGISPQLILGDLPITKKE